MVKINRALLPIKAHYFFFMAGKFIKLIYKASIATTRIVCLNSYLIYLFALLSTRLHCNMLYIMAFEFGLSILNVYSF